MRVRNWKTVAMGFERTSWLAKRGFIAIGIAMLALPALAGDPQPGCRGEAPAT